jgi:NADH-quinone oxidoreductase subunit L
MHHDQDMRNMGGLRKYMPITWITSLLGSLALIGTPFFAGFYSKDSIIEAVHASNLPAAHWAYFAVVAGVFVTAFYSFRMYFLVFHGEERFGKDHGHHGHDKAHADDHADDHGDHHHGLAPGQKPHESPWVVTLPLVLLAIPSVIIGALTIGPLLYGNFFADAIVVDAAKHPAMAELAEAFHGWAGMATHALGTLPLWLAVAGVVVAWVFYMKVPALPKAFAKALAPVIVILENKYFLDWFNENVLARGARLLGTGLWKGGDQGIIDGLLINGSARLVGVVASVSRLVQTGHVYWYALVMLLGVFALMSWQLWPELSAALSELGAR